jgi:hypothetical protein
MRRVKAACPKGWHPGCNCYLEALEPNEDCYVHGWPIITQCPYCGQMRGYKPCKRCGCSVGLANAPSVEQ